MAVEVVLEVLVWYNKPLSIPESFLSCILSINQQALEHLDMYDIIVLLAMLTRFTSEWHQTWYILAVVNVQYKVR